ncbi:MAG: thiamine phosphate synthase [Nautiliaceae bacterium]|jgi:thiamine-phosphate pyrophosphorylase
MALYALLDFDTLKKYDISIKDFCKTSKDLKAKILQYRDKNSSLEEKRERIKEIRKYWKKPLIVNDEIKLLEFADGIHIGQEDLEELSNKMNLSKKEVIEFLRKKNKIVGLSTHNKEEIKEANAFPLSYIGLGAYRPTSTKETSNILGKKIINLIKFSYHPVAVIGGVKIYDKIPSKFKVVGSDICKLTSSQLRKKRIFKRK